jgi:hypothetical protein
MRKRTREIVLADTGLKVLIQGAGSITGSLYGPISGFQEDGKCFLQLFVKTMAQMPLGNVQAEYDLHFAAANVTARIVQIGRHRDNIDTYAVLLTLSDGDVQAINFSIDYERRRQYLLTCG